MTMAELSSKYKNYQPLNKLLNSINLEVFKQEGEKSEITGLSKKIAEGSYQIEADEGEIIAAYLNGLIAENEDKIQLASDPIINKQVLIYTFVMPTTGWKILVVSPLEKVNEFARTVTYQILKFVIILELVILLLMLLVTSKVITTPLASMSYKLSKVSEDALENITLEEQNRPDEIGHLALEINKRSNAIKDAVDKLKESNVVLEEKSQRKNRGNSKSLKTG